MREIKKTVFVVCGNEKEKEIEKDTIQEAEFAQRILKEILNINSTIEKRQKIVYKIEKGDKVHWLNNGEPDTNRTDIITDIVKNMYGDKQYLTKEINGNRIGQAYECHICLVQ